MCRCSYEPDCAGSGKPGFVLCQGAPHRLTLLLAQENKNFKLCDVGRAYLGNVKLPASGATVDAGWTALPIARQSRDKGMDMAPWVVELDLPSLPAFLASPDAIEGTKCFQATLKLDLQEVERIGPLEMTMRPMHAHTVCILTCVWHVHCMYAGGAHRAARGALPSSLALTLPIVPCTHPSF